MSTRKRRLITLACAAAIGIIGISAAAFSPISNWVVKEIRLP